MKAKDDKPNHSSRRNGNEQEFNDDMAGSEFNLLDSELGENQNYTGSEDSENNYYNLGGDDYYDLEDD